MTPLKVSIVTPSFNSARYIRETIQSVITQNGDFSIEYIVVDNCSTDGTKEIVEEFQQLLISDAYSSECNSIELKLVIQQDSGMYDAINKGFARATGDIFAWLNADDVYLPGAFAAIARVFSEYEDIHWVKGVTSYINSDGVLWKAGSSLLYDRSWIQSGVYGRDSYFIQQDSVFWRSWVWEKSGGIDTGFRLAGDYYLWTRFAELSPLVTVRAWTSCFRTVKGQLSEDFGAYMGEVRSHLPDRKVSAAKLRLLRIENKLPRFLRKYLYRIVYGASVFSVILIEPDGSLRRVDGKYHEVVAAI